MPGFAVVTISDRCAAGQQVDTTGPAVAQLLAQQCRQIGKRPTEAGFHLQVLQDQHGDQRRPDLRLDRIGAGAQERLYFRCLLQGLKQQGNIKQSIFSPAARRHPLGESRRCSRPRRWAKNELD